MNDRLSSSVLVHKALGHPARIRILAMLSGGELCVCQLKAVLELAPSTMSAHLAELRRAGLVIERKDGRWVRFALSKTPVARKHLDLLWSQLEGDRQLAADGEIVEQLRVTPLEELCGMSPAKLTRLTRKARRRRTRTQSDKRERP